MVELSHVVFACLVVLVPILDRPLTRWLKESSDPMKRVKTYAGTIGFCLIMVTLALVSMPQNLFQSPFGRPNSLL